MDIIRIKSSGHTEFNSHVVVAGKKYLVVTEATGGKNPQIASMVYLKGEIVSTRKVVCEAQGFKYAMEALMKKQHELAINWVKAEKLKGVKTSADYLEEMKALLRRKAHQKALLLLREALAQYPDDPFILSSYGSLTATVGGNHQEGIEACNRAFTSLRQKVPFGQEFFYPSLYLNLGRAYLAVYNKKEAIETFKKGLHINMEDDDLLMELKKLGIRQKKPVSFLSRSNPINKYTGMLLSRLNSQE